MGLVVLEVIVFQSFFGFGGDGCFVEVEVFYVESDVFFDQRENNLVVGVLKYKVDFLMDVFGFGFGVQFIYGDCVVIWQK